jgi:hypothetical protein
MSLSSKDPAEKIIITFNFTAAAQALSNPEIFVSLKGTSVDIPSMKATGPVVNGYLVSFMIQGGESGKSYDIKCLVDLANGEHVAAKDVLVVKTL